MLTHGKRRLQFFAANRSYRFREPTMKKDWPNFEAPVGALNLLVLTDLVLFLVVRWPFAPLWMRSDAEHDYNHIARESKKAFVALCYLGFLAEALILGQLVINPLLAAPLNWPMLWWWSALFAVLTIIRFAVWVSRFELHH